MWTGQERQCDCAGVAERVDRAEKLELKPDEVEITRNNHDLESVQGAAYIATFSDGSKRNAALTQRQSCNSATYRREK